MSRWCPSDAELKGVTPVKARDLIVNCFFEAQKETLSRAKEKLGKMPDDISLHKEVETIVRITFRELGADFEHPTKETLGATVMALAKKAEAWGTPKDIIEHHKGLIQKIFENLL